jgi:hypothetical protein
MQTRMSLRSRLTAKRYSRSGCASNQAMPVDNSQMVKIFILAILAFALCSCADFEGFHLKPARDDDYDNFGHVPGSGDPS